MRILAIILAALILTACGGHSDTIDTQEYWEVDVELCEAQDGVAGLAIVYNVNTGEEYMEVDCEFPKGRDYMICKIGHNCPYN